MQIPDSPGCRTQRACARDVTGGRRYSRKKKTDGRRDDETTACGWGWGLVDPTPNHPSHIPVKFPTQFLSLPSPPLHAFRLLSLPASAPLPLLVPHPPGPRRGHRRGRLKSARGRGSSGVATARERSSTSPCRLRFPSLPPRLSPRRGAGSTRCSVAPRI